MHHYSKSKSQHCTIWTDKSTCKISVANLLFDIENPFLFCMLKNFAWDKNLQTYCETKMSENFSCIIAVSRKTSIVPFGLTNAPVTFQQLIVSVCLF